MQTLVYGLLPLLSRCFSVTAVPAPLREPLAQSAGHKPLTRTLLPLLISCFSVRRRLLPRPMHPLAELGAALKPSCLLRPQPPAEQDSKQAAWRAIQDATVPAQAPHPLQHHSQTPPCCEAPGAHRGQVAQRVRRARHQAAERRHMRQLLRRQQRQLHRLRPPRRRPAQARMHKPYPTLHLTATATFSALAAGTLPGAGGPPGAASARRRLPGPAPRMPPPRRGRRAVPPQLRQAGKQPMCMHSCAGPPSPAHNRAT